MLKINKNSNVIFGLVRLIILSFEQVDIPISKNQALQIIYLKHHVYETSLSRIRNLMKSTNISTAQKLKILPYIANLYITIRITNIPCS